MIYSIEALVPNLVSISPIFDEQLFHSKIPKAQKDTDDLTLFLCFWDLYEYKLQVNMLRKFTSVKFTQGVGETFEGFAGYFTVLN